MNLIERAKNMIITPKTEWVKIASEEQSLASVATSYVVPIVLVGAAATFIGYGLIGVSYFGVRVSSTEWGIKMAIIQLASALIGFVITSYVVDALAPSFGSEKNINKSAQLVGYGYTPAMLGAIFNVLPAIALIGSLFGLYGIYLMYLGLGPIKKTPEDKKVVYLVVTILVLIVVYFVIGLVLRNILLTGMGPGSISV